MVEYIREISATVVVDTNKRTIKRTISADSFDELMAEINDIEEEFS
jgi:hypothetical protein